MTEIYQEGQFILGIQQNADHITNTYSKAPWKPSLMLPPRAQSFVGREGDLVWLIQQLQQEPVAGGRAIAICGPGGMGKTALIAEALAQLVDQRDFSVRFPDGIFYHSFYSSPVPGTVYGQLARIFQGDLGIDCQLPGIIHTRTKKGSHSHERSEKELYPRV